MPDLLPGQPKGGPSTPTKAPSDPLPLPAPPASLADADLKNLSPEQLQERISARERDMKFRIEALRHEARALGSDVRWQGRPVLDLIREHKEVVLAAAGVGGLLLGLTWGTVARARRRPEPDDQADMIEVRMASLLEDAARRVARGTPVDEAVEDAAASAPVVYRTPPEPHKQSAIGQLAMMGAKSFVGLVATAAANHITQAFHEPFSSQGPE